MVKSSPNSPTRQAQIIVITAHSDDWFRIVFQKILYKSITGDKIYLIMIPSLILTIYSIKICICYQKCFFSSLIKPVLGDPGHLICRCSLYCVIWPLDQIPTKIPPKICWFDMKYRSMSGLYNSVASRTVEKITCLMFSWKKMPFIIHSIFDILIAQTVIEINF